MPVWLYNHSNSLVKQNSYKTDNCMLILATCYSSQRGRGSYLRLVAMCDFGAQMGPKNLSESLKIRPKNLSVYFKYIPKSLDVI